MSKGKTRIKGIYPRWRSGMKFDAIRVQIHFRDENGKFIEKEISSKTWPDLRSLNGYLKVNLLRKQEALYDPEFKMMFEKLTTGLQREFALEEYIIREKIDLRTKFFDFTASIDQFERFKSNKAISRSYASWLRTFWIPFFIEEKMSHPKDLIQIRKKLIPHIQLSKTIFNRRYSPETYSTIATPLNEWMRWLKDEGHISEDEFFTINARASLEDYKRGRVPELTRNQDTYSLLEIREVRKKIDEAYSEGHPKKLKNYIKLFGICTGLRRGNLAGLKPIDLFPDEDVPKLRTRDNLVNGWSRGEKGTIILNRAGKAHVGVIEIPFLQPDKAFLCEVARYIKKYADPNQYLVEGNVDHFSDEWKRECDILGIKYVFPHGWKHSYATNGAENLMLFHEGEITDLMNCCLHKDIRTTMKYVNKGRNSAVARRQQKLREKQP